MRQMAFLAVGCSLAMLLVFCDRRGMLLQRPQEGFRDADLTFYEEVMVVVRNLDVDDVVRGLFGRDYAAEMSLAGYCRKSYVECGSLFTSAIVILIGQIVRSFHIKPFLKSLFLIGLATTLFVCTIILCTLDVNLHMQAL